MNSSGSSSGSSSSTGTGDNIIKTTAKAPTSLKDGCMFTSSMLIEKVLKVKRQQYDPQRYNPSLIFSNGLEHHTLLDSLPLKIGYESFPNPGGVLGSTATTTATYAGGSTEKQQR